MRNWKEIKAMLDMPSETSDYDVEWLKAMIKHHKAALKMSKEAISKAEHVEVKDLAKSIIKNQSAEIEKMQGWIDEYSKNH